MTEDEMVATCSMHMGEKRNAYKVLVGIPEEKKPRERPRLRWIHPAQDRAQWRAVANAVMNLQVT
jgi:hypothetical protein